MFWFWAIIAIMFLIIELTTFTFGFIFISFGSLVLSLLLGLDIIADTDILYQLIIILFFAIMGFYFFYKTFKKSKTINKEGFKEDMSAVVVGEDIKKGVEGKIKWSGTICNAMISNTSKLDLIPVGSIVIIEEFRGNIAFINKDS